MNAMQSQTATRPNATAPLINIQVDRVLTHPHVINLLEEHLAGMRAESPPECVYALDLNGLRQPEVTFLTAWRALGDGSGNDMGEFERVPGLLLENWVGT
jgi:hypothetical protein